MKVNSSENQHILVALERLVSLSIELHSLNSKAQKCLGLSLVQWAVLSRVVKLPGISASSLAEECGIHSSSLSPMLCRLEDLGLVHIYERPKDLRRKMIIVSTEGYELLQQVQYKLIEVFGDMDLHEVIVEALDAAKTATELLSLKEMNCDDNSCTKNRDLSVMNLLRKSYEAISPRKVRISN